jgi:phosphate-selective porin OprO/OprP
MKKHVTKYHPLSQSRRVSRAVLLAAAGVATTGAFAGAGKLAPPPAPSAFADDAKVAALEARVAELDQQIRILARKAELKNEADAKAATAAAKNADVALGTGGFTVNAKDKSYSFKIGLLLQTDYRWFADQGNIDSNESGYQKEQTFFLRRVRLPISGTWGKYVTFNVTPEFAAEDADTTAGSKTNTQLFDAWSELRLWKEFGIRAGKFRTAAALSGPDNRHFIEAPFTNQLLPNRDLGLDFTGAFTVADGSLGYRLGLYNGAPNNDWKNSVTNLDSQFTLGGRLSYSPFKDSDERWLKGLEVSIGFTWGSETGKLGAIKAGSQRNISQNANIAGERLRLAPAISYYAGPFSITGEFAFDRPTLAATGDHAKNTAWAVSAGWVITGEDSTPNGVNPEKPFSFGKPGLGAFEIVARINGVNIDDDLAKVDTVESALGVGVGLNWWLTKNFLFRLGAEYTTYEESKPDATHPNHELYVFSRLEVKF